MLTRTLARLFLATLLTSVTSLSFAGQLTLLEVYQLAKDAAPELALARHQVDSADSQRKVAMSRLLPQVSLFGQFSKNRIEYEADFLQPVADFPGQRYGVQIKQPLLTVSDGLEATRLKLKWQESKSALSVTETQLLLDLIAGYFDVLLADEEANEYKTELDAVERQLEEANALFARKLVRLTDVLEIQSRLDSLRADVIMARGKQAIAREGLYAFTGIRGIDPRPITENFSLFSRFSSADAAADEARSQNPAITTAEIAVSATEKAIDRERAKWVPKLELMYSLQRSDVGFDNTQSPTRDTSTIALGFNYPLFEGGARSARLQGARADFYAAKVRLQAAIRDSESRARAAWLNLQAAAERVIAARQAQSSAGIQVAASRKAAKSGAATLSDVLMALAQETTAKRRFAVARFEYAMSWIDLELAAGASPLHLAEQLSDLLHQ